MHNCIIHVSSEPIDPENSICTEDYYDNFVGSVAEYVGDELDEEDTEKYIKNVLKDTATFGKNKNGKYFIIKNKKHYFERNFENFKKALDRISNNLTLEAFSDNASGHPVHYEMHILNEEYNDKYGLYFDQRKKGYYDLQTADSFVRNAKPDTKYYYGIALNYHC